jgi:hypothetical protein
MAKEDGSGGQKSEQISEGNVVGGRHQQYTDATQSTQTAKNNYATELKQTAATQQTQLRAFGISGKGIYAVIGVIIIVIVFLTFKYGIY